MPDRWRRTEAALEAALRVPPEAREKLLSEICGSDDELRQEVESLLAADAESHGFLSTSAESFAAPFVIASAARESKDESGNIIGRYRLVDEIGRGGMGTVWLAERADGQFEQRVALKLIKRGMDSDEILGRFIRERQILARLDHPNIARLLDGGVSDDGRPYFAMELVSGSPITTYCNEQNLSIEQRLQLLIIVARAVAYAHRNLIVHRDIKPSNVLVDQKGEIKLLDFGIAKLLDDENDSSRVQTRTMSRLMTAEYASPEQTAGSQVTTSSDVYQLGILLYELLTGNRPRADGGGSTAPVRRPSTIVRRERDDAASHRLRKQLKGDLDIITLRALRDEPERRYPSAEDLAEDIKRYLTKRPIRFRADSATYRAQKFVRRHRLGVALASGIFVLIVGLTAFDTARVRRERDRARHEADKATEITQLMARFLQGWSPDASDRGAVSAPKLLGEAAIRAERELADRPEMLAATLSILGDLHTTLGEWRTADSLLTRAQLMQNRPAATSEADRAATMARRGRLYRYRGRFRESAAVLDSAVSLHRSLFGNDNAETLRVQRELASSLKDEGRFRESERVLHRILAAMAERAGQASPFTLEVSSDLGYVLFMQARYDDAINILRPTLARQRALFGYVHVATLHTIRSLGSALRDRGDVDEAERYYREALRISRALYGENHTETEGALLILALAVERKNNLAEAESLALEALAVGTKVRGPEHPVIWGHYLHIGAIRLDRGDLADAERWLRLALAKLGRRSGRDPDEGDVLNRLAWILVSRGAPDANRVYRDAVAFDNARPPGSADFVTDGIHFLAMAQQRMGDTKAAARNYQRALRIYEKQLPPDHPYRIAAQIGLGQLKQ